MKSNTRLRVINTFFHYNYYKAIFFTETLSYFNCVLATDDATELKTDDNRGRG